MKLGLQLRKLGLLMINLGNKEISKKLIIEEYNKKNKNLIMILENSRKHMNNIKKISKHYHRIMKLQLKRKCL
jgi:hypothetical protein